MTICGGMDWQEVYSPLLEVSGPAAIVFLFYIFFVTFGVMNVVTGAFVDSMRLVSQRDSELVIEDEMNRAHMFKVDVTKIFEHADKDRSGTLCWEEFEEHLQDDRVKTYFKCIQLDISEARALFTLLDVDETNEVVIDKFIDGCMRMRGDAKSIDVNMLLYETEKMLSKVTAFQDYAEDQFTRILLSLGHLSTATRAGHGQRRKSGHLDKGAVPQQPLRTSGPFHEAPSINAIQQMLHKAPSGRRDSGTSAGIRGRTGLALAFDAVSQLSEPIAASFGGTGPTRPMLNRSLSRASATSTRGRFAS
jgi:hypothetical protein